MEQQQPQPQPHPQQLPLPQPQRPFSACRVVTHSAIAQGINAENLSALRQVEATVRASDLDALMQRAESDMDGVMSDLCSTAQVQWLEVRKRTPFQIALYYVFLSHALKHVWTELDTTNARNAIESLRGTLKELEVLVQWGLVVEFLTRFIPPLKNKNLYMLLCSALASNCQKQWVVGGGKTQATAVRLELYELFCRLYERRMTEPMEQPAHESDGAKPIEPVRQDASTEETDDDVHFAPDTAPAVDPVVAREEEQGVACNLQWLDLSQNNPFLLYCCDDSLSLRLGARSLPGSTASSPSSTASGFSASKRRSGFDDLPNSKRASPVLSARISPIDPAFAACLTDSDEFDQPEDDEDSG